MSRRSAAAGVTLSVTALAILATVLIVGVATRTSAGSNRIIVVDDGGDNVATSALASRGAKIVDSLADARNATDETTKAVVLTNLAAEPSDDAWIKEKVNAGMVIAVLGASSTDLADAFGLYADAVEPDGTPLPPAPTFDGSIFGDDMIFGLVIDLRTPDHNRRAGMTERFLSTDQFLAHLERYIGNAGAK